MHFIYLQQSGKPVEGTAGHFWVLAGVAMADFKWKALQLRLNGLQRSFMKGDYNPISSAIDANRLLHPRNAGQRRTRAICKGLEKIVAGLEAQFFLVVVDKRATDKPPTSRWLLPLTYGYLMKPILQYLREADDVGALVIPPGREDEARIIAELQVENLFGHQGRTSPLIASPIIQHQRDSCGLQVADFVATTAKRYHETVYPRLFAKETLTGYDAVINSHYQGFVKPGTYQSNSTDAKGYRIRGYIYLWRRDARGQMRDDHASSVEIPMPRLDDHDDQAAEHS